MATVSIVGLPRIGDGPVATVYSGHSVALKVLPKRLDKHTLSTYQKEQAKLAQLRRIPSMLLVDGIDELPSGEQVLRMELCTQSLAGLVARVGPLGAADVVQLAGAVANALAAAHGAGVVHGGMSPHNVLFRDTEPVLGDFGVTLRQAFARDPLHAIEFLPPETLRTGVLNESTDLYGLGAVLHFALIGRSPHPGRLGEQPGERVLRILGEPVPAINAPGVPVGLATLVARLLSAHPEHRPRNAAQVAALLAEMLPTPPPPKETSDWDDFDGPIPAPPPTNAPPPVVDDLDFDDFEIPPRSKPPHPVLPYRSASAPAYPPTAPTRPAPAAAVPAPLPVHHAAAPPHPAVALGQPAAALAPAAAVPARPPAAAPTPAVPALLPVHPPLGQPAAAPAPAAGVLARPPAVAPTPAVPASAATAPAPASGDPAPVAGASAPAAAPAPTASAAPVAPPHPAPATAPVPVHPVTERTTLVPLAPPLQPAAVTQPPPDLPPGAVPGQAPDEFSDFGAERVTLLSPGPPEKTKPRRLIRYDLLAGAALVLALFTLVPLLLLNHDPEEIATSAELPPVGGGRVDDVRVELGAPTDLTDKVKLAWRSTRELDFAVVVAAEGKKTRVVLAERNHSMTIAVEPGRKYCFLIQASDGDQVYESDPVPLRGATCRK